jgi:hypothetical protein
LIRSRVEDGFRTMVGAGLTGASVVEGVAVGSGCGVGEDGTGSGVDDDDGSDGAGPGSVADGDGGADADGEGVPAGTDSASVVGRSRSPGRSAGAASFFFLGFFAGSRAGTGRTAPT